LLEHPALWRGANAARTSAISTGFPSLDACLPGHGWPRSGLVEILIPRLGSGELYLLMPLLAALTQREDSRWCTWVAPPHQPFAPALVAHGVTLEKVLVVRTTEPVWAFEQALSLNACDVALAWVTRLGAKHIRRSQFAAKGGSAIGVLFREHCAAAESSSAMLRVMLEPDGWGIPSMSRAITTSRSTRTVSGFGFFVNAINRIAGFYMVCLVEGFERVWGSERRGQRAEGRTLGRRNVCFSALAWRAQGWRQSCGAHGRHNPVGWQAGTHQGTLQLSSVPERAPAACCPGRSLP